MKYILMILFFCHIYGGHNQRDFKEDKENHRLGDRGRRESIMIWRLTEGLELTSEQAEKFFPKFREHRNKIDEIRIQIRESSEKIEIRAEDDNLSSNEIINFVKKNQELRKKIIDFEADFVLGMGNTLNPRQVAKLASFKERMMKDMKSELKGKKGKKNKKEKRNKRNKKNKRRY